MSEKQYNPAGHNDKAPQPGMASVDTDNNNENDQPDKKQPALKEVHEKYDKERTGEGTEEKQ